MMAITRQEHGIAVEKTGHVIGRLYVSDLASRIRRRLAKEKKMTLGDIAEVFSIDNVDLEKILKLSMIHLMKMRLVVRNKNMKSKKNRNKDVFVYNF